MATLWSRTFASLDDNFRGGAGPQVAVFVVAYIAVFSSVEWPQFALALVGVALAAHMQDAQPKTKKINLRLQQPQQSGSAVLSRARSSACSPCTVAALDRASALAVDSVPTQGHVSHQPVLVRTFAADDFEGQVREFTAQLKPSPECHRLARDLAASVRQQVQKMIPEADVRSVVTGSISRGTAFCVAVPEVEIVIEVGQCPLVCGLRRHMRKNAVTPGMLDTHKLQKLAVRVCTDYLVACGSFRFRRSAFRATEPKVTLVAAAAVGFSAHPIAFDFSVNSGMCLYNAALIKECANLEPRARDLILLVRCWAKDRGVCHAPKGHLPPYAWTLLVIYYLQAGVEGPPLLPALQGFKTTRGLAVRHGLGASGDSGPGPEARSRTCGASVAELFAGFVRFYIQIDWQQEAVSVRRARRAPPNLALPLHTVVSKSNSIVAVPSIEDPFEPRRSLGALVTSAGVVRLGEELARAERITSSTAASLSELLEPWMPPAPRGCGAAAWDGGNSQDPAGH